MPMCYGYNDAGTKGCGVVHLFPNRVSFEAALPFCGRRQHYIPAGSSDTPKCKMCERSYSVHPGERAAGSKFCRPTGGDRAPGHRRDKVNLQDALQRDDVIAVYEQKRSGKHNAIVQTRFGVFEYRIDYEGVFAWGATASLPDYIMRGVQQDSNEGMLEWVKTPRTNYHVWHICYCPECNGRGWTHSQGDWDSHLRTVDNSKLFTFPTACDH